MAPGATEQHRDRERSTGPLRNITRTLSPWIALPTLAAVERAIRVDGLDRARARFVKPWLPWSRKSEPDAPILDDVDGAIRAAAQMYWRRADCLPQAITAHVLLRFVGLEPVLHIGARTRPFVGHAWTTVSGRHVGDTEETQLDDYVELDRYPDDRVPTVADYRPLEPGTAGANMSFAPLGHIRHALSRSGDVVVIDRRSDDVLSISGPGALAFSLFARGATIASVRDQLSSQYDATPEQIESEISKWLSDWTTRGWIGTARSAPTEQYAQHEIVTR